MSNKQNIRKLPKIFLLVLFTLAVGITSAVIAALENLESKGLAYQNSDGERVMNHAVLHQYHSHL